MPQPILSVLIPAFEAEKTIHRAVESVLSEPSVEVVITPDDGTHTYKDLEVEYAGRVKVLAPSLRIGPGKARNRAFEASVGTFITMLDCDDYFGPGALREALDLARNSPAKIAFFRTVYIHDETGVVCRELPLSPTLDFQTFMDFHGSIHALYRRDRWRPYSGHRISQDVLFDANLLAACDGVAPLTRAPHFKTLHPKSVTSKSDQHDFDAEYRLVIENAAQLWIKRLFREKLRMGELYGQLRSAGSMLSFHEFMRQRGAGEIPAD